MIKCLYCGLEAQPSDVFDGVQLYECPKKHRTGIIVESQEVSEEKEVLKIV